jgi:nitrite reductase (NADH) large subunit
MRLIIIGNGIAGVTAARVLKKNSSEYNDIKIFTDESYGYYPRPKLPSFLENPQSIPESLITYDRNWFVKENFNLHLDERILEIDRENKVIKSNLTSYSYDKLLLANGADCACPPIPGMNLQNTYEFRSLSDAINIKNSLLDKQSIAIIGGGLLGIEIAVACAKRGKIVTIFEFFPRLLPRQLDKEGASLLAELLANRGINVILDIKVEKIVGENEIEAVQLSNGQILQSELLVTCTGIKPRIALAREAGLEVNKGVIVNNYLETSDPNIYAAGDVIEHKSRIYGIIPPSIEQATIAAHNMLQPKSKEYTGSKISATLKVADIYLTSIGFNESFVDLQSIKYKDQDTGQYIKIFHHKDSIKAAIIFGTKKGIPIIRNLINQSLSKNINQIREYFPEIS